MAEDDSEAQHLCNYPRVEIDAWGQRLHGCIQCNQWMNLDGEWLRLPEQDIAALRGITDAWRCLPMSHEIPTVPAGSIKTEQDGDDLFLLLHGGALPSAGVTERGRPKNGFRLCLGLTA
jgi:hypothetical protein